jgi:hypothetical protein
MEEKEGEFQKLKCSRDERRWHPQLTFYRGAKGRLAGQGRWPAGTKFLNFDAPPISKSRGGRSKGDVQRRKSRKVKK